MTKKQIGKSGEELAEKFLRANGYEILTKNYRTRLGEIDIIAQDAGEIAFIEVKTRTSQAHGTPQESITRRKLIRIKKLAHFHLAENNIRNKSFRIDIISIQLEKNGRLSEIEHIKNV